MQHQTKGFFSLLMVGLLFGLSGPLAKLLSDSFSAYEAVVLRFGVALLIALVINFFIKNKISFIGIPKKTLTLFSISFPVSVILFVLSIYNTKVTISIFTYYIADSITSFLIGFFFLREKIDKNKLIGLLLLIVSLGFFTNIIQDFSLTIGMLFGLLSGVTNAIASYYKKIIKGKTTVLSLTILQTISGVVIASIAMIASGSVFVRSVTSIDVVITILYGIVFLIITYLMIYGFQNFNLNLGSIVVSSELIFGPIFAYFILNEIITKPEFVGSAFVIIAIFISNKNIFSKKLT